MIPREQCPSHKWFIFRVFGVFRGLNCCFQQSLSVSISVHPWLTLLPLVFRLEVLMFRNKNKCQFRLLTLIRPRLSHLARRVHPQCREGRRMKDECSPYLLSGG